MDSGLQERQAMQVRILESGIWNLESGIWIQKDLCLLGRLSGARKPMMPMVPKAAR